MTWQFILSPSHVGSVPISTQMETVWRTTNTVFVFEYFPDMSKFTTRLKQYPTADYTCNAITERFSYKRKI